MTANPRPRHSAAGGFVLVGVLMFILVLTILGLTLFSLSSLESQFYNVSRDRQNAFYAAASGIERAKFVLSTSGHLTDAQDLSGVPIDGLVYTVAKQGVSYDDADSTGSVNWTFGGSPVWIRSLAVVHGDSTMIEARFSAERENDNYRRLFTLSDQAMGLEVSANGGHPGSTWPAAAQVDLEGGLSQFSSNLAAFVLANPQPNPLSYPDSVSPPAVASFIAARSPAAALITPVSNDQYTLNAMAAPNHVAFFKTPFSLGDTSPTDDWSLNIDNGRPNHDASGTVDITVRGACIWMFDRGVRFHKLVQIHGSGSPEDALIIVAQPGHSAGEPGRGIVFNTGLGDVQVPLILVTNGGVGLEHTDLDAANSTTTYLSVYAGTCGVIGPRPGYHMRLRHSTSAAQDQPGGLIDRLIQNGYLPNTSSGITGDLTLLAGTWREIKLGR